MEETEPGDFSETIIGRATPMKKEIVGRRDL